MLLSLQKHGTKYSISHSRVLKLHRERAIWRSENFTRTRFVVCRSEKPRAVKEGLPRGVCAASVKVVPQSDLHEKKRTAARLHRRVMFVSVFSMCVETGGAPHFLRSALPSSFLRGKPVVQLSRRSLAPADEVLQVFNNLERSRSTFLLSTSFQIIAKTFGGTPAYRFQILTHLNF